MLENFFSQVDDECKGWLNGIEAMIALRGVNNRLTMQEEEYLYRVSVHCLTIQKSPFYVT